MSLAVDLDRAGGRLDQAQDGAADRRLAAADFADQAQRLALADREADAVDGIDLADRAAQQALATGKCFLRSVTSSTGGCASAMALRHWSDASTRPSGRAASPRRAAARGGTCRRRSGQRGAKAQPAGRCDSGGTMPGISCRRSVVVAGLAAHQVEPRDRGQQAARVGMQRLGEQLVDRRPPRPCGRHTSRSRAAPSRRPRRDRG